MPYDDGLKSGRRLARLLVAHPSNSQSVTQSVSCPGPAVLQRQREQGGNDAVVQRVKPHSLATGPIALVCLRYENVNEPYLGRVWYDVVLVSLRSARLKSSLVCGEACLLRRFTIYLLPC